VLKYCKLGDDVPDIEYATEGSACFDLRAWIHNKDGVAESGCLSYTTWGESYKPNTIDNEVWVAPGERILIPTGIIFDIPVGYSVRLHPRSGMALKQGLTLVNCEGVIDSDYVEPVYVAMTNCATRAACIKSGDRICQAEFVRNMHCFLASTDERPERKTSRSGGFGSTGV